MRNEQVQELGAKLFHAANKAVVAPKDFASSPRLLAEFDLSAEQLTAEVVAVAQQLDRQDRAATEAKVEEINRMVAQINAKRAGLPPDIVAAVTADVKPSKKSKTTLPADDNDKADKPKRIVHRLDVYGFSVTSVLRWMGKQGWTEDEAATCLAGFPGGHQISIVTIRLQLKAGAKGERGEPAPITKSQARTLKAKTV